MYPYLATYGDMWITGALCVLELLYNRCGWLPITHNISHLHIHPYIILSSHILSKMKY